jgi:hypothetical protein
MTKFEEYAKIAAELAAAKIDQALARKEITAAERKLRAASVTAELLTRRLHKLEAKL